ncbi:DNA repair protein RadA [Tepiditoga spiralis]|uniref:DNA repair protein RadA n=1 Tax=Tepiditoga spiralis TaxID=2108365 RepID=A0A7G1G6P3_9BACT|nr:DNA repair protein RadA [Tepiditoga spiralis]BBE32131.1 DNA repair protein RadA [Tepiditoga spiralis]
MKKKQKYYVCNECGYESLKWFAKCPECESFGTAVEFSESKEENNSTKAEISFLEDSIEIPQKIQLSNLEMNELLNGGIVQGGVYLLSGEPGIGKSTLLAQITSQINDFLIYVSGEESKEQVIRRFKRLNIKKENLGLIFENDIESIIKTIKTRKEKPKILFIDSIQTMKSKDFDSIPGSIIQVRECTRKLTNFAKKNNISVILVGHVNKEGAIAGPKVLEHIVDSVIQFELEKSSGLRMLRVSKNRFGPTDNVLLFEMTNKGLKTIENISEYFISEYSNEPGNTLTMIKEGNKIIPIEIQVLVSKPVYGSPRRVTSGVPIDRVLMIIAVLSKKMKLPLESKDIFVNTSGGFKLNDSGIDAAIAISMLSSLFDKPTPSPTIAIGEIGLDGKLRTVHMLDKRIEFAKKIGIDSILVPKHKNSYKKILEIKNISEFINLFKGDNND